MRVLRRFAAAAALLLMAGRAGASYSLYLDMSACCGGAVPFCTLPSNNLVGWAYCKSQVDTFVNSGPAYAAAQAASICGAGGVISYTFNSATYEGTDEPECAVAQAMLRSGLSGGGFVQNGFSSLNAFGAEEGESFFSSHYNSSFADWSDDSAERWRSYLARNAVAKEEGIAVWPSNPFAVFLEWLYRTMRGSKKQAEQPAGVFAALDSSGETAASARYQEDYAGKPVPLLRDGDIAGPLDGTPAEISGDNSQAPHCQAGPAGSVPPSYGISYNSLYGGQSETTALKIERFPDGRAVFTDPSNTRWTFRPYGGPGVKGDSYYRPPLGSAYRLVYGDISGRARGYRVESTDGGVIEFSTAPAGNQWRPSRYNAADGSWFAYNYGANGLARITDMHGRYFAFERGANGLPITVTDEQGRKTAFTYDRQGRVTDIASPDGFKKTFGYGNGLLTSLKNGSLAEERYTYDDKGRLLTSESKGGVNRLEHYYNDRSSKTVITDALGAKTVYAYENKAGRKLVTAVTDASGGTSYLGYDANYNIAVTTDALGRATRFERNNNGDPAAITDALGNTSTIQYQVKLNYRDAAGEHTDYYSRPIRITDALGRTTKLDYDSFGNLSKAEDALGNKTSMGYDKAGHMLSMRDAVGSTYKYEYNMGLTKTVDPLGRVTSYRRDADLRVTQLIDPLGRSTTFTYDLGGNVTEVGNPAGFVTKFAYGDGACPSCAGGQLSALTDPKGNTWTFNHDQYGRLTETANTLGQKKTYQHDKMSRVTEVKDPAGNRTTHTYDALNRLTRKDIQTPSGEHSITSYVYDKVGNLLNAANADGMVSFAYDELNRPVETITTLAGKTYPINYTYDVVGNRTSMSTPWGKFSYTYDVLNRAASITNPQGMTAAFKYDAAGRRVEKTIFKSTTEIMAGTGYSYDAAGQLLEITNKAGGKVVAFNKYTYDEVGNRVRIEDQNGVKKYTYDKSNRLIIAEPVPMRMPDAEAFVYDKNGNRRFDRGAFNYKYDAANRLLENTIYTYTHDLNGNLTSRTEKISTTTITYAYNPEQQLSVVATPEGAKVEYRYDPLGRRLEKSVNGAPLRYVYDNEDIIAILDGNNNLTKTFTHGPGIDEPLIMTKADGANYYYHADGLGSITALTDDKSGTAQTVKYQSYGKPVITLYDQAAAGNPYYFTAREYDAETGLYYYRARYYDWRRGAFTQEDPIGFKGGDTNLYAYVADNPINFRDSKGLLIETVWDVGNIVHDLAWGDKEDLAFDIAAVLIPGVPAGLTKISKLKKANKCVVIGESMKERVIPYAKKIGAKRYKPRSKIEENWLKNNESWIKKQMREGNEIIDIGIDVKRKGDRSKFYQMEKEILDKYGYPYRRVEP